MEEVKAILEREENPGKEASRSSAELQTAKDSWQQGKSGQEVWTGQTASLFIHPLSLNCMGICYEKGPREGWVGISLSC